MAMCKEHEGEIPLKIIKLTPKEKEDWATYQKDHKEFVYKVAYLRSLETLVMNEYATEEEFQEKIKEVDSLYEKIETQKSQFYDGVEEANGIQDESYHLHVVEGELLCYPKK